MRGLDRRCFCCERKVKLLERANVHYWTPNDHGNEPVTL
jgi:hypothetical protein